MTLVKKDYKCFLWLFLIMVENLNYVLNVRNGCDKISSQSDFWGSAISWTMAGLDYGLDYSIDSKIP